jgi:hypothetical protein
MTAKGVSTSGCPPVYLSGCPPVYREKMEEIDIETILQRAHEEHPNEKPRVITDNGPQFISHDFEAYIRMRGMPHVRTSPQTCSATSARPQSCPLTGEFHLRHGNWGICQLGQLWPDAIIRLTTDQLAHSSRLSGDAGSGYPWLAKRS